MQFLRRHAPALFELLQKLANVLTALGTLAGLAHHPHQLLAELIEQIVGVAAPFPFARHLQGVLQLLEQDKARLAGLGRQAGSAGLLLDALFQQPIANISHLCQRTGLTPATVGKLLNALEKELGIVNELTGQKRNRIYAYRAYIDILNQDPS